MKRYKDLDELTQAKVVYSIELGIFAIAFIVIGILEMCGIIGISDRHHRVFNWITIFGAGIILGDFLWFVFSKKHRRTSSWLDKSLTLPVVIYLIVFDSISFANNMAMPQEYYQFGMPVLFLYLSLVFIIEIIYHWKHPLKMLLDEIEKEKASEEADKTKEE